MELGKYLSCTEKGKDRKKPKAEEGEKFERDRKGNGKKKNRPLKDGGHWLRIDRRKAASAVSSAGVPYLIRAA